MSSDVDEGAAADEAVLDDQAPHRPQARARGRIVDELVASGALRWRDGRQGGVICDA